MIKILYFISGFLGMIATLATKKNPLKKTAVGSHFTLKMDEISSVGRFWFSASSGPVTGYLDWTVSSKCGKTYNFRTGTGTSNWPRTETRTGTANRPLARTRPRSGTGPKP
jgi:hypothetical protein